MHERSIVTGAPPVAPADAPPIAPADAPSARAAGGVRARLLGLAHRVGAFVPAWLGANLHRLPPRFTFGITGPFNGQRRRVSAVAAMFEAVPFGVVIETGTYRALTTLHLRGLTQAPIATVEVNPRYFRYARRRLRSSAAVYQFLGDSPAVLRQLAADATWRAEPAFFYLDAHWLDNLPLCEELAVVRGTWHEFAVLIDDFRVDGDEGYFYDDYGPGKALVLDLLDDPTLTDLRVFWPAAHSSRETGARRGWVVLASPGPVADALAGLAELRGAGTLGENLDSSGQG
jgi:hypothetical protein